MKTNRLLQCVVFFAVALACTAPALAQSNYVMPRSVELDQIVRRNFGSYYVRSFPGGPRYRLYTVGFYPVGWSRDGKFAYYLEPVDEECGCYFAQLVIRDLRTDKVLWKFDNDPQKRVDAKGDVIADDMRKLWRRNQKMFSDKLRENGIIPVARFGLLGRSFVSGGHAFTATVIAPKGQDDDGSDRVKSIRVDLGTPALGRKTLYTSDYSANMYTSPLDAAIAGVFKSPYENRVAVVLLEVQRGWEGPPNTVDVDIIGADLTTGFRK